MTAVQRQLQNLKLPFTWKLFQLLEDAETDSLCDIVSWLPDGKAFQIYKPKEFSEEIMPAYFNQTKFKSFTRQLYIYGFIKLASGPNVGAFFHPEFVRSDKKSSLSLRRNSLGDRRLKKKSDSKEVARKPSARQQNKNAKKEQPSNDDNNDDKANNHNHIDTKNGIVQQEAKMLISTKTAKLPAQKNMYEAAKRKVGKEAPQGKKKSTNSTSTGGSSCPTSNCCVAGSDERRRTRKSVAVLPSPQQRPVIAPRDDDTAHNYGIPSIIITYRSSDNSLYQRPPVPEQPTSNATKDSACGIFQQQHHQEPQLGQQSLNDHEEKVNFEAPFSSIQHCDDLSVVTPPEELLQLESASTCTDMFGRNENTTIGCNNDDFDALLDDQLSLFPEEEQPQEQQQRKQQQNGQQSNVHWRQEVPSCFASVEDTLKMLQQLSETSASAPTAADAAPHRPVLPFTFGDAASTNASSTNASGCAMPAMIDYTLLEPRPIEEMVQSQVSFPTAVPPRQQQSMNHQGW